MKRKFWSDLIRAGYQTWNRWRMAHFDVAPDLSGVDLCDLDLSLYYLYKVPLRGAKYNSATIFPETVDPDEAGAIKIDDV